MNFFSILAFILAGLVFGMGALTSTDDPGIFLNPHAFLIVIGGSMAAAAIAFQFDRLWLMLQVFVKRVVAGRKENYVQIIRELMELAEAYRTNAPDLKDRIAASKEPFIREGLEMALDGFATKAQVCAILERRAESMFERYRQDAMKFKIIGRYPPAFGLMGTTLGMIGVLRSLGTDGVQKIIGQSMSVALVATLYGLTASYLLFGPIAENLLDSAKENRIKYRVIVHGIGLIMERANPVLLAEELNSFLLPSERINWKTISQSQGKTPPKKVA